MPKQYLNINNFSRGINNVKNPRDLVVGELAECINWNVSKNGELVPRSEWATAVNGSALTLGSNTVPSHTASLNPGYGLFYFESDDTIGVRGTTITANGATGSTGQGPDGGDKYTICFYDSNKIFVNDDYFWRDIAKFYPSPFSYDNLPFRILISGAQETSNNGIFNVVSVVSLASSGTITVESSNSHTMSTNMVEAVLILAESTLTSENVLDTRQINFKSKGFVGDYFLALGNTDDGKVDVYVDSDDAYSTDQITVLNNADGNEVSEFVYYFANNALRVADGNFRNESTPKWYGFIERNHLGSGTNVTYRHTISADFYEEDNDLAPPTSANYTASGSLDSDAEYPTTGAGWGLSIAEDDEDGDWEAETYKFACSFIYDGNQESLLKEFDAAQALATGGKKIILNVYAKDDGSTHYGNRVTGGRIYTKKSDDSVATGVEDPWALIADIDLAKGVRTSLDADYTLWRIDGAGEYRITSDDTSGNRGTAYWVLKLSAPNLDTYETINGYPSTTKQIAFGQIGSGYKTAVIGGRRAFVANIKYSIAGNLPKPATIAGANIDFEHFGDRIMFSRIGRFDTFPAHNFIDVTQGDGEDYVKLSFFADRLLAFKQRTLQILNIASPSPSNWFLEKTIPYAGIIYPYSLCETEFGIIWANKNGAYMFDGSGVKNITEGKIADAGSTSLSSTDWENFSSDNTIVVGYIPDIKQVIFIDRAAVATNAFYYDLRYKSWYYGKDAGPNTNNAALTNGSSFVPTISNMVNDSNGKLIVAYDVAGTDLSSAGTGKVHSTYHQTTEQSHKYYKLETPDFHFGHYGQKKKVYAIFLHYRHSGSSSINDSEIDYMINQDGTWVPFNVTGQVIAQTHASNNYYGVYKLKPSVSPISGQSIRFRFNFDNLTEDSKFAINDIAVQYRVINQGAA